MGNKMAVWGWQESGEPRLVARGVFPGRGVRARSTHVTERPQASVADEESRRPLSVPRLQEAGVTDGGVYRFATQGPNRPTRHVALGRSLRS